MATIAQTQANQANAQHSSGPKTEAGKATSSSNHLLHGFAGRFRLLSWEDPTDYDSLLTALRAGLDPANPAEYVMVERMAQYQWLVQRALILQNRCFEVLEDDEGHQRSLTLYLRYQTTHERAFSKCMNDLLKLRAEKRKQQIGFESQKLQQAEHARKQQIENRKQDVRKFDVLLAEAKVEHQELLNHRLETPECRVPNRLERLQERAKAA